MIRLGQVVVGAGVEPLDALIEPAARGQHQDRDGRAVRAQLPADVEAVDARQQDVEDDEIVVVDADLLERAAPSAATSTA